MYDLKGSVNRKISGSYMQPKFSDAHFFTYFQLYPTVPESKLPIASEEDSTHLSKM